MRSHVSVDQVEAIATRELDRAVGMMGQFRPALPFSVWERAAAFSAFLEMARAFRTPRAEAMMDDLSMAARAIAIEHAKGNLARSPHAAAMRRAGQLFDPVQEAEWGRVNAQHDAWNQSVTRAMVLLLRGLVRPLIDTQESAIESLIFDVPLPDLEAVSDRLFERAMSIGHEMVQFNGRDLRLTSDPRIDAGHPSVPMAFVAFRCPGDVGSSDGTGSTPCGAALSVPQSVGPFHSICPRCYAFHVVTEEPILAFARAADRVIEGAGAFVYVKSLPATAPLARAARVEEPIGGAWMAATRQFGIAQLHTALPVPAEHQSPEETWTTFVALGAAGVESLKRVGPVLRAAANILGQIPGTASPYLPFALAHRILTFRPDIEELHEVRRHFARRF